MKSTTQEQKINAQFKRWVKEMKTGGYASEGHSLAEDGVAPLLMVTVPQLQILENYINDVLQGKS